MYNSYIKEKDGLFPLIILLARNTEFYHVTASLLPKFPEELPRNHPNAWSWNILSNLF
jgi:hypothetical protein